MKTITLLEFICHASDDWLAEQLVQSVPMELWQTTDKKLFVDYNLAIEHQKFLLNEPYANIEEEDIDE